MNSQETTRILILGGGFAYTPYIYTPNGNLVRQTGTRVGRAPLPRRG